MKLYIQELQINKSKDRLHLWLEIVLFFPKIAHHTNRITGLSMRLDTGFPNCCYNRMIIFIDQLDNINIS